MDEPVLVLIVGAVLAASVLLALASARIGVPLLIGFLALGMLMGSDGPGGIEFDDAEAARAAGTIGLVAILFEGGLSTSWRRLRSVAVPAALLSTVGVAVTAILAGLAAYALFDLSWLESVLLGAVVASTDAAAVFATLRFTRLRRRIARLLEAESGGNDPMAIALTIGLIAWIEGESTGMVALSVEVIQQLALGLVAGIVVGAGVVWAFPRLPPAASAFAPVASVATAALAFGAAGVIGGSGFLAVYLAGLALGSTPTRFRRQLVAFHQGLAFLAQVALFVVLGLLVFPSELDDIALKGLALAGLLVVVIRPVAVWLSTIGLGFSRRERLLVGWAGLRGAAPIVIGTFVLSSEIGGDADRIFNVVFFVVVVSTLLQGTTLEWVAARLGLVMHSAPQAEAPLEIAGSLDLDLVEFNISAEHSIDGSFVRELGLPRRTLVAVVLRGDEEIAPRGSTKLQAGDRIFVLVPHSVRADLEDTFARWRQLI